MIRTKKRMILCTALLLGLLAFIWGNSLQTGEESGGMSRRVLEWIQSFLQLGESGVETLHHAIRKMAHFTEFACLGLLTTWWFGMMGQEKGYLVCMPLLFGLLTACVDETIQTFVPDRGPSLMDVWLDTFGVAAGIVLLLIGHHYIRRKQTNNKNLEETK